MAFDTLRQSKIRQRKFLPALFAWIMLLGCAPDADRYLDEHVKSDVEVRAIRNLLSGFAQGMPKGESIGIIIGYEDTGTLRWLNNRPARYIAYFKYRHDDENIAVHYHLFPVREKYADKGHVDENFCEFKSFLEKFATGPSAAFFDGAKLLEMPLPWGLKDDSLLSKPYKKQKYRLMPDPPPPRYWGFILKNRELIQKLDMYPEELRTELYIQILEPIELHLVYHETPAEWIEEFKKKLCEDFIAEHDKLLKDLGVKK